MVGEDLKSGYTIDVTCMAVPLVLPSARTTGGLREHPLTI
jgi:hypothetical protein